MQVECQGWRKLAIDFVFIFFYSTLKFLRLAAAFDNLELPKYYWNFQGHKLAQLLQACFEQENSKN